MVIFMNLKIVDEQIIDVSTGEIIPKKDIINAQKEHLYEEFQIMMEDSFILEEKVDIRIIKVRNLTYNCVAIKERYTFNKVFRGDLKMLYDDIKLSIYAHGFISRFIPLLNFPFNNIIVNNQIPTVETLSEMLNIKRSKMFEILKELEQSDIIKRCKDGKNTVIYFNPFLFCGGLMVHYDTYKLFENSVFNPKNNNMPTID